MTELPSVNELRALAATKRAADQADKDEQRARERAAWEAETERERADLIPRLTEELKRQIAQAAESGRTSTSFVPRSLPSFPDNKSNYERYVPILDDAAKAIKELDPAFVVSFSYKTGTEWCSDGAFSDGICHVQYAVDWDEL